MATLTEDAILSVFKDRGRVELETVLLYDEFREVAHADVVRVLERLEHGRGLLARRSRDGRDFVVLTVAGAELLGLAAPVPGPRAAIPAWQPVSELTRSYRIDGSDWRVMIEGAHRADGTWAGRIRFTGAAGSRVTSEETSQPDRGALEYWASGLEPVYLSGAFARAR